MFRIFFTVLLFAMAIPAFANTKTFDAGMQPIFEQYLQMQSLLASDDMQGIRESATRIGNLAKKLDASSVSGEHAGHYKNVPSNLAKHASAIENFTDLKAVRKNFKELSKPMAMWAGMSKPKGVDVVYCPMAKASWLQKKGKIRNPYYGQTMLSCGEFI